jgi:hypothetical protein
MIPSTVSLKAMVMGIENPVLLWQSSDPEVVEVYPDGTVRTLSLDGGE